MPHLVDTENVELFEKHGIFTATELHSRCDIMLESISKIIAIEANTMLDMAQRDIIPATLAYTDRLAEGICRKEKLKVACAAERKILAKLTALTDEMYAACESLEEAAARAAEITSHAERALAYSRDVRAAMAALRTAADAAELETARDYCPFPTYSDILFYT